jgi:LuxR family maltose regulon positive regulatory protein
MSAPLLSTKLHTPPVRPGLVSRPRLIERLNAGLGRRLTIVSAQAGFGKTTLVTEWLNQLDRPSTWLSLDEGDNDPVRFLTYLVAALQSVDQGIGRAVQGLLGAPQPPPVESLMTLLINDVAVTANPFVLVLDEYDTIYAETIHEAIGFLVEHQPQQVALVLVARQDPLLPLPRLRVRRQVAEICENDLRFTLEESAAFLHQALGMDLDRPLIAALEARTEGWIAGLQLAALSMCCQPDDRISAFVQDFGGSHRHNIDYLADEVLSRQDHELRCFLCQTSILTRLSASLCDAVTGRSDSREVLRQLEQSNLFLVPLDGHREWYRYHRLFADFLRTELDVKTQSLLHKKAASWLESHKLLPEAVDHAMASGDLELAARMVSLASAGAMASGSLVTLQGWLDALPRDVVGSHADLATVQSFLLFFGGRISEAVYYGEAAERSMPPGASPSIRGRLLSMKAHLALCADDQDSADRFAREALTCLEDDDAVFRNLTVNLLGQALEAKGDVAAAVEVYRQAAPRRRRIGREVGAMVVITNLVLALNELGAERKRWPSAIKSSMRILSSPLAPCL